MIEKDKKTVKDSNRVQIDTVKKGYARYKRSELLTILKPVFGKIVNISTGIEANLSKHSIDKMTSAKALEKSKKNGFRLAEHFELAAKESITNGHRIYSIELDEINKASERFQGLSDAAEKSANRATKTPHVDNSSIPQTSEKSSEESK